MFFSPLTSLMSRWCFTSRSKKGNGKKEICKIYSPPTINIGDVSGNFGAEQEIILESEEHARHGYTVMPRDKLDRIVTTISKGSKKDMEELMDMAGMKQCPGCHLCYVPKESDKPCMKCELRKTVLQEAKVAEERGACDCATITGDDAHGPACPNNKKSKRGKKRKRKTEVQQLRESYFFPDTPPNELTHVHDIHLSRRPYSDTTGVPVKRSFRVAKQLFDPVSCIDRSQMTPREKEIMSVFPPGSTVIG
jgi:hypothetical protein